MATGMFNRFMELPIELKLQIVEKMKPETYARFHQTCHYAYDFCEKYHYRLQYTSPFLRLPSEIKIKIIRNLRSRPFTRLRQTCQFMDEFYDRHQKEFGIYAFHNGRAFGLQNASRTILYQFYIRGITYGVHGYRRYIDIMHRNNPVGLTCGFKTAKSQKELITFIVKFIEDRQRKVLTPNSVLRKYLKDARSDEELAERSYNALISEIKENSFGGFTVLPTSRAPFL